MIPVFVRAKTVHALDRAATVIGRSSNYGSEFFCFVAYDVTAVDTKSSVFWDITPRGQLMFRIRRRSADVSESTSDLRDRDI
jgi:hypothetical protein